ncbi:hypothetical protein HAX54_050122 [Datura stramonium]|uniref:Uncharacterized protein n=1 Tax=Datura stramonium TaxID=4076 RepID=A0ABS8WL35_DATST|nr:hypothetical protein [Datura stramonium]
MVLGMSIFPLSLPICRKSLFPFLFLYFVKAVEVSVEVTIINTEVTEAFIWLIILEILVTSNSRTIFIREYPLK